MEKTNQTSAALSLSSNQIKDFWLLGGLSILTWILFLIFDPMKANSELVSNRFLQISVIFSWLSFVCNYPHFLISYKFAYMRGSKFIWNNWFPLIAVPLILILFYFIGYLYFNVDLSSSPFIQGLNALIMKTGLTYQIGSGLNLGSEVLSFSVRIMYATVGWHYAKQIFGCMMVYSKYSHYSISKNQRLILKLSLFSIAFYNFFYMSIPGLNETPYISYFFNIPITTLGFSELFIDLFKYGVFLTSLGVAFFIFYKNYQISKKFPPINVLVPYIAFHIWWMPPIRQSEFYFLTIPFFHSLQYLPFAYRMEVKRGEKTNKENILISFKIFFLVIIGIMAFETIPHFLDTSLSSYSNFKTWFFMISFAVFINIHHFFIDSAIWKFSDQNVKEKIFS